MEIRRIEPCSMKIRIAGPAMARAWPLYFDGVHCMMDLLAIGEFEPATRALSGRPKLPLPPKIDYESAERPPIR